MDILDEIIARNDNWQYYPRSVIPKNWREIEPPTKAQCLAAERDVAKGLKKTEIHNSQSAIAVPEHQIMDVLCYYCGVTLKDHKVPPPKGMGRPHRHKCKDCGDTRRRRARNNAGR